MVQNQSNTYLGSASAGATGVLVPSGVGGAGVLDTIYTDFIAFQLAGTFAATILVEGSFDGTTWAPCGTIDTTGTVSNAGVTATGIFLAQTPAPKTRLRCSAYTSGTVSLVGINTDVSNAAVNH